MQYRRQKFSKRPLQALAGSIVTAAGLSSGLCFLSPQTAHATPSIGTTFQPLYSFGTTTNDGYNILAPLTEGNDGDLYGVAYFGGGLNGGDAFKITPSGTYTVLHSFDNSTDGGYHTGSLVLDPDGDFYGTAQIGGSNGEGTVYKMTPAGTVTPLYSFTLRGPNGSDPQAGLTPGPGGLFYGSTYDGGDTSDASGNGSGVIYSIDHSGTFTLLHTFHSTDGENPWSNLLMGTDGNLYGTTISGGANGYGTVFKVTPAGTYTLLHSFNNTDGSDIYGGLAYGPDGSMYGTASSGGANGDGSIYKIATDGTFSVVHDFNGADGATPYSSLILGTDGNFYGTTYGGGVNGTIYEITPSGTLTTIYSFSALDSNGDNSDGANCYASLVEASDGTLYGSTLGGGANGHGTLFKLGNPAPAPTPTGSGVRFDFNGDGKSDLVWYNTASGDVSTWNMNDDAVLGFNPSFATVAPSSGWQPVASTDVNSDGWPDLMWWNGSTGEMSFWTMANQNVVQYGSDFATISDTDWKPEAIADVSGSAYSVVFQNSATGDISRWTMQGTSVLGYGGTIASLGANSPWHVVGAPDLDGDGKSDLLFWNSSTGEVSYWGTDLANSQVLSFNGDIAQVSDTNWHLVGSEDTDGDGHADLVWWNASTGEVSRWLMNGTTIANYGGDTAQEGDTTWQPTAVR